MPASTVPETAEMVRLGEGSEVIIAPKDRKRKSKAKVEETQEVEEIKVRHQTME